MIGNDIVDLEQAAIDSNWKRKGYLDKIFNNEEQFMITSGICSSLMVWLLWSMKESAYKIYSREIKIREFAPLKLKCNNLIIYKDKATGNVFYENEVYYTESFFDKNYVHTIASTKQEELERVEIKITDQTPPDYKMTNPNSVSHHGAYLALVYL
ncbi:4'-phosphopantetheinyl transferase superfamily protein [Pedobacter sp. B4-66]|uniref:4'-phosphopantetheinyl transferase family protein n=1 Tax=Pedobacter sp. B4-66 TaxID=2817280 RepID=UPI001BDA394B|nr:4'-phosphopantetheinyl transferase superfamily protein [Pedobacter sp. B4-66]